MTGNMKQVWLVIIAIVYLEVPRKTGTAPVCVFEGPGCRFLSLADLLDRVIQLSDRVHGISNDLHSQFEQYLLPTKHQIGKRKCHTYTIVSPDGKENAQRMAREELTEVILRLLEAWEDPLFQLHQSMAQLQKQEQEREQEKEQEEQGLEEELAQDLNFFSSNKALEMSDMVHRLKGGVEIVAEKMQLLGILSNTLSDLSVPDTQLSSSSSSSKNELNTMEHHNLIYCFRRDSNKVQSYLRLLKCSILPEQNC